MRVRQLRGLPMLAAGLLLAACQQQSVPPVAFHADSNPQHLQAWHVVDIRDGYLQPNRGVVPYAVNAKLFSDYADKMRTVWMPEGTSARYKPSAAFDFPIGTILSKTFYYPLPNGAKPTGKDVALSYATMSDFVPGKGLKLSAVHLIETRLLVHRKAGWQAMTYVWNAQQSAAHLAPGGAVEPLVLVSGKNLRKPFAYVVPSHTQCAICHNYVADPTDDDSPRHIVPIGPTARHLNRDFTYASGSHNQLEHWQQVGYLTDLPKIAAVPRNADWTDTSQSLNARARSYLDANCSYCHNPHGEANYTSLWLESTQAFSLHTGLCKTPVAAGRATGGRLFDLVPGKPDASIMPFRMASTDVGVMMPEVGRTTFDRKGVALITAWIASLPGQCAIIHRK